MERTHVDPTGTGASASVVDGLWPARLLAVWARTTHVSLASPADSKTYARAAALAGVLRFQHVVDCGCDELGSKDAAYREQHARCVAMVEQMLRRAQERADACAPNKLVTQARVDSAAEAIGEVLAALTDGAKP